MLGRNGLLYRAAMVALLVIAAACGTTAVEVPPRAGDARPPESQGPGAGPANDASTTRRVIPAPDDGRTLFAPNPEAIVVYVDPGHGGCLDWGVPNPFDNTVGNAEKTITLGIGRALRDRLEDAGATVILSRDEDEALAGDRDPRFGCDGPPFRDVNGDGARGFDPEGHIRTRDEMTARIDLANLVRADVMLSIHINSLTENGQVYEIAATQTFYTDETAWGQASERLAGLVQEEVTAALDLMAAYERQDRGIEAINYYIIAPPLTEPTVEDPEPRKRPRGILMPGVLSEVGSMSLEVEGRLLAGAGGQAAVADALFRAIAAFVAERPLAVRYDAALPGGRAGEFPAIEPGDGPPFVAPDLGTGSDDSHRLTVRFTNTGSGAWPARTRVLAGWEPTDEPYLATPPERLESVDIDVPRLAPGEAVELEIELPRHSARRRHVAWLTLASSAGSFADLGSPALQVASDPR